VLVLWQVVVVIGNFASGADISRDIAKVAKEVHIASRASEFDTYEKLPVPRNNLWIHSEVKQTNFILFNHNFDFNLYSWNLILKVIIE